MRVFGRSLVLALGALAFGVGLWQSVVPALDEHVRQARGLEFARGAWGALTTPGGIYRGLIPHGLMAPPFTATTHPDHQAIDTDLWRGKVVVLGFFATWCEPCRKEAPIFRDMVQEYTSHNVIFWSANDEGLGDPAFTKTESEVTGLVSGFLAKNHLYDYPVVYPSPEVSAEYRVRYLPTVYVIGRNGRVVFDWAGPLPREKLRAAIEFAIHAHS